MFTKKKNVSDLQLWHLLKSIVVMLGIAIYDEDDNNFSNKGIRLKGT